MYPKLGMGQDGVQMNAHGDLDFDELMRSLTLVGFVGLMTWAAVGTLGLIGGYVEISPGATLRFLAAICVLVFARRAYWQIREWRWRKLPPDSRSGFVNPLIEHPHGAEFLSVREGDVEVQATTGSPQRQG
jgi:hypothetical protein